MPEAEVLTDAEVDALVAKQDMEQKDEPADETKDVDDKKVDDKKADDTPELSDTDKEWLGLGRQVGGKLTPAQLMALAEKGYGMDQVAAAAPAKTEEKPEPAKGKTSKDEPKYVTAEDHAKAMQDVERRMLVTTAGVQAQARMSALLDKAGLSETGDPIGRKVVSDAAIKAIAGGGVSVEQAFGGALDDFKTYLSGKATGVLREKIAARSATGNVGGGVAVEPAAHAKMEHKHDDFDTGKVIKDAMNYVAENNKAGMPR